MSINFDKYTLLKADYENLQEELGKRNATVLQLQMDIKEMKTNFMNEKDELIAKIEKANDSKVEDFGDIHLKLDGVIKENEELSKRLYHRDLENKQNMINKNRDIKLLQKEICELKDQIKSDKENSIKYRNKYKTELIKQQDKFSKVVSNLKNRIKFLEVEVDK